MPLTIWQRRQAHREGAAAARRGVHRDGAAMGGDDRLSDGQSQPAASAGAGARRVGPVEALEDVRQV